MNGITKYERVRLIGIRATQIANGAKPLTDITGLRDPIKIAEKEYYEGTIPLCIIRTLPDGRKIKIRILKEDS